ncbi:hypothetical protein [Tenacibaculum finnmarkense]|uniref:hypothetical protein n=1 Tax=Tenacibaculum finnmarkense TaxID=2781243 RepID=UPI001EFB6F0E|nr:hypothetical protein [Tenacibaculum finnmarkense]MCG8253187.1 hypothetical protein [Tenacibaculum finnmarkense genomovar finnmarkense]MCG8816690.1 hypothetical protein [Tenacibaculum finnmarkense]MCG8821701.1 hypothetical protein [Tenacibaculum finnmarkense]
MGNNIVKDDGVITLEKMKVYQIIFTMLMQFLLIIVSIVILFIILFVMIDEENNVSKGIYAIFETILGSTLFLVYGHFFPVNKKKK